MKKLTLTIVLAILAQAAVLCAKDEIPGASKNTVAQLADTYGLLTPSPYSYHFQNIDLQYWAEQKLPERDLRKHFKARQMIRSLAEQTGYRLVTVDGDLTAGVLSYWAERLLWEVDTGHIRDEFSKLVSLQSDEIGILRERKVRPDAVKDGEKIKALAAEYGLFDANDFAWTFREGDVIWYLHHGMTLAELRAEFASKAAVRKLAAKTRFKITDANNIISPGQLSYWAEYLKNGTMSEENLERHFAERAQGKK